MASNRDSSEDFFSSFGDNKAKPVQRRPSSSSSSTRRAPPPPPPPQRSGSGTSGGGSQTGLNRPATAAGATSSSYYGSSGATAKPPTGFSTPATTAATTSSTSRGASATATSIRPPSAMASSRSSASTSRPVTSYYGTSTNTGTTAAPAPPAAASSAAFSQPYGTTPASAAPTTAADTGTEDASDWYTGGGGMTQPAQPMQPLQPAGAGQPLQAMNPYATNPSNLQQTSSSLMASSSSLEGAMDTNAPAVPQPSLFVPTATSSNSLNKQYDDYDLNEPPLLEELGVNIGHIALKTKAVVMPSKRFAWGHSALTDDPELIVADADLAGPLAFALLLGGELLLSGKIQFGYIYGFGLFGCLAMTLVLNLMSPQAVSVWTVTSILGYSLLPVNLLAAVKILLVNVFQLSLLLRFLALVTIAWSTTASTRLLEVGCNMRDQRYLLAYPIMLLYSAFVLITIF